MAARSRPLFHLMSGTNRLTIANVQKAAEILDGKVQRTPVLESKRLSRLATEHQLAKSGKNKPNISLVFKCENMQTTGCFKFRGVANFMLGLSESQSKRGVVSYSTGIIEHFRKFHRADSFMLGNHAEATAHAAKTSSKAKGFAIKCTMIMPENAPPAKVEAARRLGAKVILRGTSLPECSKLAAEIQEKTNATFVPPSGDPDVVSGQGTTMFEFLEQLEDEGLPSLDAVIVPAAGSGLLAGTGTVCQDLPIRVYGVEPAEGGAGLRQSRQREQRADTIGDFVTVADGLRSPTSEYTWRIIKELHILNGVYAATDTEIKTALQLILEEMKIVLEPASAVPLAVILFNKDFQAELAELKKEWTIGVILSGGNTTVNKVTQMFS